MDDYTKITDEYSKITKGINKLQTDVKQDLLAFGFLIGIILTIIGFVLLLIEIYLIVKIQLINHWPVTKNGATIQDSYMENLTVSSTYSLLVTSSTQFTPYYRTTAAFIYHVGNNTYLGQNISYYEPWEPNAIIAKLEKDLYKKGAMVNISINPNDPAEAYIINKSYDRYWRLFFAIVIFLVGLYITFKV